jgi:hypothetical protein
MSTYYCNFVNNTNQTWTMGVYQTLPSTAGLDSVSWLQSAAPVGGNTGVQWNVTYNVALADYQQVGGIGVYKASQVLSANLGTVWDIVTTGGVQQLVADTSGQIQPEPDEILILNQSNLLANPGIGMSGQGSVYKHEVLGGADAQFVVTPTYWIALFDQVELGDVISSNVSVGPIELQFDGNNAATLTASLSPDHQSILLNLAYSQQMARTPAGNRNEPRADLRKAS